ncbi:MAG: SDR family NAD(P)-dependent oxidoreductase [Rhodospirillales bacterium]|nr:SDR family NAD(P)-dependent oxidoreductase [Alphaproteobacteria bacterium]MCB9986788.1 SDR family NAD(P)-dependent oxidoreductase [Rhodospirillales bacterium]USO08444.1 MAG: SDR family NAD(P)-dependent oxidoreductase [Rhodospirillales bacterium]
MNSYIPECVMITGATGDFGQAFAQRFAALGSRLVVHGRDADKVAALVDSIEGEVYGTVFDMTDQTGIERGIDSIPDHFREVDLLINNAGGALGLDAAQNADLADWDAMVDMNVRSLIRVTRLLLPRMVARKRGHIINIGSIAGSYAYPGGNVYGACKAFVRQFSFNLRADLPGTGVRVTNIEPGMVETRFSLARFKGDTDKAAKVYANTTPLVAEDIAESVVWAATLPPHVNVNAIEIMPTTQSFGPLAVERFA